MRPGQRKGGGLFGGLKIEPLYGGGWNGATPGELAEMLDAYLRWHRDVRLRSDPGYRSPMQYRRDLGLAAQTKTVQDSHRSPRPKAWLDKTHL